MAKIVKKSSKKSSKKRVKKSSKKWIYLVIILLIIVSVLLYKCWPFGLEQHFVSSSASPCISLGGGRSL